MASNRLQVLPTSGAVNPRLLGRPSRSLFHGPRASGQSRRQQRSSTSALRMATAATAAAGGSAAASATFPTLVSPEWLRQHLGEVKVANASWYLVSSPAC